jgi:hypothetical protein
VAEVAVGRGQALSAQPTGRVTTISVRLHTALTLLVAVFEPRRPVNSRRLTGHYGTGPSWMSVKQFDTSTYVWDWFFMGYYRSGYIYLEHTPPAQYAPRSRSRPPSRHSFDGIFGRGSRTDDGSSWQAWMIMEFTFDHDPPVTEESADFAVAGETDLRWLSGGRFLVERGALQSASLTNYSLAVIGWAM